MSIKYQIYKIIEISDNLSKVLNYFNLKIVQIIYGMRQSIVNDMRLLSNLIIVF